MSKEVVQEVQSRASNEVSASELWAMTRRAGVPQAQPSVDAAARTLLAATAAGKLPAPRLRTLLIRALNVRAAPAGDIGRWLNATAEQRGAALYQLLLFADAVPAREHAPLPVRVFRAG